MPPSLFARAIGFSILRFNADKATGGGSDKSKTDLEKLQDSEDAVKNLKADLAKEKQRADGAEAAKVAAEGAKKTADEQLAAVNKEKGELQAKLDEANGKVHRLEGSKQTVDQKAQELAAAHNSGAAAGKKDKDDAAAAGGQPDGKSHYDAYQAAMAAGENRKATEIWDTNVKAITAYVATIK